MCRPCPRTQKLCTGGDTALTLRLDFYAGGRVFGRTRGHLCTLATTARQLLTCLQSGNAVNLTVSEKARRRRAVAAADPDPMDRPAAAAAAPVTLSAWGARLLILRTAGMTAADVVCLGLAVVTSVLPWRGWILYKQLAQSSSGFHLAVLGNTKRALVPNLLLEPLAVAVCVAAPWRLPKLLRALFIRDDQAHQRARRNRRLVGLIMGAGVDYLVIAMAGVVLVTGVRAPALVYNAARVLRGGPPPLRDTVVTAIGKLRAAARGTPPPRPRAQDEEIRPHECVGGVGWARRVLPLQRLPRAPALLS